MMVIKTNKLLSSIDTNKCLSIYKYFYLKQFFYILKFKYKILTHF